MLHWRGPSLPPKFRPLKEGGKCLSVSPRFSGLQLLGKEGLDGLGMLLETALAWQDRNPRGWRWKSSPESPQLCNAGAFPSLCSWLFWPHFWGWPTPESSPHKAAPGFTFSMVTAHPVIDVSLFLHWGFFGFFFSPWRWQEPTPLPLVHPKPWPIWIIISPIWGMALKTVLLIFPYLNKPGIMELKGILRADLCC